jgi:rsbT co-antagonist protein RsbR
MTTSAQAFLNESRRQIVRRVALSIAALSGMLLGLVVVLLIAAPGGGLLIYTAAVISVIIGSVSTYALYGRRLGTTILPLTAGIFIALVLITLFLPQVRQSSAPFMAVVVLMASLASSRRLTAITALTGSIVIVALLVAPPLPNASFDVGILAPIVALLAPIMNIVVIWLMSDQFLSSQNDAIALADRRTAEAEVARSEAEAARAEAEQRSGEQARLLDLVQSLELPVLAVGRGVLAVPLIGSLDSRRLIAIRTAVLDAVARERAHSVVFDVTGITAIDSHVARELIQTGQAVRLLGARAMISGVRAPLARTLSSLNIPLADLTPVADLHEALTSGAATP